MPQAPLEAQVSWTADGSRHKVPGEVTTWADIDPSRSGELSKRTKPVLPGWQNQIDSASYFPVVVTQDGAPMLVLPGWQNQIDLASYFPVVVTLVVSATDLYGRSEDGMY